MHAWLAVHMEMLDSQVDIAVKEDSIRRIGAKMNGMDSWESGATWGRSSSLLSCSLEG